MIKSMGDIMVLYPIITNCFLNLSHNADTFTGVPFA